MNWKRFLPIIGIIILIYVLTTLDGAAIIAVFTSLHPLHIILSFLSIIPIILFFCFVWYLILKCHNISVSYVYVIKNLFIGFFYGFITPGGFGAYTKALYLRDESGEPLHKCTVNVLLLNTIDYMGLLTPGIIGGFFLSSYHPYLFPLFLLVFILFLVLLTTLLKRKTGNIIFEKLVKYKLLSLEKKDKWFTHLDLLYSDIPRVKDLFIPYVLAVLGWVAWFVILFFIAKLFAIHVPLLTFLFMISVVSVLASLPISIYGLGTREAAMIWMFSFYEIPVENIVSFSLFWFVILWLTPSIIGAIVTTFEGRTRPILCTEKETDLT